MSKHPAPFDHPGFDEWSMSVGGYCVGRVFADANSNPVCVTISQWGAVALSNGISMADPDNFGIETDVALDIVRVLHLVENFLVNLGCKPQSATHEEQSAEGVAR